ncbi:MAG: GNAT family N-acetyltransferase [Bacteroidetes bacterium]|nr:GNAT family N-acetyltransferase [Bacteroidota bacterium]
MLSFRTPNEQEFQNICHFISEFELDDRGLIREEFTVAIRDRELVGFVRLRNHADCIELCSLGVVTNHRRQGIGKAMVSHLIKESIGAIHLVCIIPEFFYPFGFAITGSYPNSIQNKLEYCISELVVPEPYVAMILKK